MQVRNVEKNENNTATFQVEVDPAEFDKAVDKAFNNVKGSINIPGFRKGKAPRAVVEGMYGADAFYQDAIEVAAPDAFGYGIDNSGLKMIGRPSMTDFEITDDKSLVLTFKVDLFPVITLGQYKGLSAQKGDATVTDEMVEAEINADRKRNSRFVDVDREAQEGDTASIDFDGYLDGEKFDGGYGEGMTVTSAMKGLAPTTIDTLVDVVVNGNWDKYAGKIDTLGLVSGDDASKNYVQIPVATTQFEDGKFTAEDYAALVKAMFDGSLVVSNDITAEPAVTNVNVSYLGNLK